MTAVIYVYFFTFYIVIMVVFRLFPLMNIQKVRLMDFKTSILAQDQIDEFRTTWRTYCRNRANINIDELFCFLSALPHPLGLKRTGVDRVLFKDLDRLTRQVLLCIPKGRDVRFTEKISDEGNLLMIYVCNFHILSLLLLIYICKLHWNRSLYVQPSSGEAEEIPIEE